MCAIVRGVQRHPLRRRKMRHRNPWGTNIRKLGAKFKFGQLVLRKIIKIVAIRCHILRLKCAKFDFGWGSDPDPAAGAHSAPQIPYLGLRGPTSKGRGGRGREKGKGKKGGSKWRE